MDNNQLFKAVVDSQNAFKNELLAEIKKLDSKIDKHREETKNGFKDLTWRADMIGKQLNTLDDNAPTGEEFKELVERVDKLEKYQTFVTA